MLKEKTTKRLCAKVTELPSEAHKSALAKLFPSTTQSAAAKPCSSSFDPTVLTTFDHLKKKKKSTQIRSRPFKRWVLVLKSATQVVPTAATRRRLLQEGREKRLEFTRAMSSKQVKMLQKNFSKCNLQQPRFLKCHTAKRMVEVKDLNGFPNGCEVMEIASKESFYLVEGPEEVPVKDKYVVS